MPSDNTEVWRPNNAKDSDAFAELIRQKPTGDIYRPDILDGIEKCIDSLSDELRALSIDIHGTVSH